MRKLPAIAFGRLDCYALTSWNDKRTGQTTMQRRSAIKSARSLVVLSSDRWTKVLVRRQAHAFEIVVGMAQEGLRAIRFQQRSYKRCKREARQPIKRASLGTERF